MKIAIATCREIPEIDVDEQITLDAFRDRGHDVELIAWEEGAAAFAPYEVTVVRSTWNYPFFLDAFRNWIGEVSAVTRLLNPAEVMLDNLDKRYLIDLKDKGVSIVPTQWFLASGAAEWIDSLDGEFVLKPVVGNGSLDTFVVNSDTAEQVQQWLTFQDPNRVFMIQPFVDSVNTVGEQSIIVIDGEPTHRIRKIPRFADGEESVDGPFEVDPHFAEIAWTALGPMIDQLLYARVDLMFVDEEWVVSELELVEPSLFFKQKPSALQRLVDAVERS